MKEINALILTGFGLNCDNETAYSCELAGAKPVRVHINSLIDGSVKPGGFQLLIFGGGFGWGDDHGAGVLQAVRMKTHIGDSILDYIGKGNLVLGICNGFQAIVNMGLLPGFDSDYHTRSVALTYNDCGNFRDQWVKLVINPDSPCIFTRGIKEIELPVRHGEGKFYAEQSVIGRLTGSHQAAVRYAAADGSLANGKFPYNPNGSLMDIAGICDPTGRIFGLMPHPEAYNHPSNHPDWMRHKEYQRRGLTEKNSEYVSGIRIFENAVRFIREC